MRRYLMILILTVFTIAAGFPETAYASEPAAQEKPEEARQPEEEKTEEELAAEALQKEQEAVYKMEVQTNQLTDWPKGPGTYGDAAIVMEVGSGAVLYAKNIEKAEFPASITKLLTALLVYRYGDMDAEVRITPESLECLGSNYASIGMKEGNVISMEQAMYAMLLASSNEVAYAVGETVAAAQGQDYAWFMEQMNNTCEELGGKNSHFTNTNGVHDVNHYTCAWDMALIGRELFQYPDFFTICQTPQYVIEKSETTEEHVFQQKHEMLIPGNSDYYEYALGGKTGYTTEAANTLVTLADNGQMQLVCVVLKTYSGHVYSDTRALLDYAFENFEKVPAKDLKLPEGMDAPAEDAYIVLPRGVDPDVLEVKAEESNDPEGRGKAAYLYEGMPVGTVEATRTESDAQERLGENGGGAVTSRENAENAEDAEASGKLDRKALTALAVVGAAIVVTAVALGFRVRNRRKRRTRRTRRYR